MRIFFARTPRVVGAYPGCSEEKGTGNLLISLKRRCNPVKILRLALPTSRGRNVESLACGSPKGGAKPCHLPHRGVGGTLGENTMARDFKREYELQKKRGDTEGQLERQRARRMYDKNGVARAGKDIDHLKPVSKGGKSNPQNLRLRDRSANRKDNKKN